MTRKEYLLKVLSLLEKERPVATGLKILIQEDVLEEDTINILQNILDKAIEETKDEKAKAKLQKIKSQLEYIKQKEQEERELEQSELAELEQQIADL